MSDYRLVIRVKNNLLHQLMLDRGIETQSELARLAGCSHQGVGQVANLKIGAFNADGTQSKITGKLCEFFGCLPEEIYPPEVLHVGIPNNVVEKTVSSQEVANYLAQQGNSMEALFVDAVQPGALEPILQGLTKRQRRVIEARFFEDKTRKEVGKELGVSATRIRDIEVNALRKLRGYADRAHDNNYDNSDSDRLTMLLDGRETMA